MNSKTHPFLVPSDAYGTRQETAVMLVGTAREFGIDQRDIASTYNGFRISQALSDVLYEEEEGEPEAEDMFEAEPPPVIVTTTPVPKAPAKKTAAKKTSGDRAAKNTEQID